ncbi:MAG: head-tail connector protein [Bacteroidota bacterium]
MILNRDITNRIHAATSYISLTDVKDHLRVVGTDEDAYLSAILEAAFEVCENYLGYPARLSTVQWTAEEWPAETIDLIGKPQSLTSVKYYDTANSLQTLATTYYNAHARRDRFRVLFVLTPPTQYEDRLDAIQYNAQMGWLPGALPAAVRAAVLLTVGDLYEERKNTIIGTIETSLSRGTEFLLNPYRWNEFV